MRVFAFGHIVPFLVVLLPMQAIGAPKFCGQWISYPPAARFFDGIWNNRSRPDELLRVSIAPGDQLLEKHVGGVAVVYDRLARQPVNSVASAFETSKDVASILAVLPDLLSLRYNDLVRYGTSTDQIHQMDGFFTHQRVPGIPPPRLTLSFHVKKFDEYAAKVSNPVVVKSASQASKAIKRSTIAWMNPTTGAIDPGFTPDGITAVLVWEPQSNGTWEIKVLSLFSYSVELRELLKMGDSSF